MAKKIFYDSEQDILMIHKGYSYDEKFKGNIDLGDIILDFSTDRRIRGVEIFNVSKIFKNLKINVDEELLNYMQNADFKVRIDTQWIYLSIFIKFKEKSQKMFIPIPIKEPLYA